jgi:DNA-binding MarR family transcriptional regulator
VATEYTPKTAAVIEIMQQLRVGRSIVEKRMTELESAGKIKFIDDPRDSRKKLISRQDIEAVVRALTP